MSEPEDLPGGPQGSCDVQRALQKRGRLCTQQAAPLVWGFVVSVLKTGIYFELCLVQRGALFETA